MLWPLALGLAAPVQAGQPSKRPSDIEKGQRLYERSCWMCHGESAAGDGPTASALPGGVPTLVGGLSADTWGPQLDVVMTGRDAMPAFAEELDRRDARRILQYLVSLEDEPPADDTLGDDASTADPPEEEDENVPAPAPSAGEPAIP